VVTLDDVRELAAGLPRSYEVVVHGRVKFRVGQIVWLAFSQDETEMGFAFPKEFRDGLIESAPEKFFLPRPSELRWNWVESRLAALEPAELPDLVLDAWAFVVPKRVAAEYARLHPG
jgi:hypothetical protein